MYRSRLLWSVLGLLAACDAEVADSHASGDPSAEVPPDAGASDPVPPIVVVGERYWVGGDGSFGDASHWAETSGGDGGASPPSSTEAAIIDERSGSPVVDIAGPRLVGRLVVTDSAGSITTLRFASGSSLTCLEDCLFGTGRVEQAAESTLAVGRHLDTAGVDLSAAGRGLSIRLDGTGSWRYSGHHAIWNLIAAQPGHTTVLRPAFDADDIDVENQVLLGDETSVLTSDTAEADSGVYAVVEIHNSDSSVDIVATGASVEIDSIQHELLGQREVVLQTQLDLTSLSIYDVTGAFDGAPGSGPRWVLGGELDLGEGALLIEKTATLDAAGFGIHAEIMRVGSGAAGIGTLELGGGPADIAGEIRLGTGPSRAGHIVLDGGQLYGDDLRVQNPASAISGPGTVTLTGDYIDEAGADISFADIATVGFSP